MNPKKSHISERHVIGYNVDVLFYFVHFSTFVFKLKDFLNNIVIIYKRVFAKFLIQYTGSTGTDICICTRDVRFAIRYDI